MKKLKTFNQELTNLIIIMHDQGYLEDFYYDQYSRIVSYQTNEVFLVDQVSFNLIGGSIVEPSGGRKFIYTIITDNGSNGLLFTDKEINAPRTPKSSLASNHFFTNHQLTPVRFT